MNGYGKKQKLKRIDQEIRKPVRRSRNIRKAQDLEAQKTEAENLEIVQMVRVAYDGTQLNAMLSGGTVPGSLADDNNEQEENSYEE